MPDNTEALKQRIAELEQLVYVPGSWKCIRCGFQLFQRSISAHTGAVSERDDPGEKCPNCNVPLWRVTERDAGFELGERCEQAIIECAEIRKQKDGAYAERNKLVRLLASLFPSGIKQTAIEGWDPEWHWCVYIDLPAGQVSWHFHVDELDLFKDLPPYQSDWDGHSTEEKYRRVAEAGRYLNRPIIVAHDLTADEMAEIDEDLRQGAGIIINAHANPVTVSWIQSADRGLATFAREAIETAWAGGDLDGGAIQEMAVRLGLLSEVSFDPTVHKDPQGYAITGDRWYVFSGPLATGVGRLAAPTVDPYADEESRCFVCREIFKDGDHVYSDETEGLMHAACCGPERECFVGPDGEPLKDGDPIPDPFVWHPWPAPFTDISGNDA